MARLHKEVKPLVIIVGICLLKFSSLQGQSFGFSLGDEHIPNNGFAPVESIGSTDDNALVCKADRLSCCSNLVGTWLFPNGTEVPEDESIGWLFWTSHGPGVLRLHRSQEIGLGQNATGLYRCLVPTSQRATVTLHVGVYHIEDASQLTIPDGLQFTLDTDLEIDPPSFILICSSTRGPVTNVSWTHDGSPVLESWRQASQVESEVDAVYHNSLSVPGRFTGQYQCTVMNNQDGSAISAALFVQDVPIPEDVLLSQLNESSLRVSWSQASGGATVLHQRIYVDGGGIRRITDTATNLGSFLLTDLQSEVTYMVTVQSLSSQLPSPVSNPVTTYIVSALQPSSPIIISLNSTSPTSLTLMWELSSGDIIDYFQVSFSYIGPCDGFDHQGIAANHLGSERREYVISGLQEYSQYLVEVTAVNVAGSASGSQLGNTLPGVPGQPTALRASPTNMSAASVHITWNHIPCIKQNSEISGYKLQHSRQSSFLRLEFNSEPSFTNLSFLNMVYLMELDYILTGLTPTIEYSISVAGVNLNDNVGPYSASAIVRASHPQIFAFMLRGELLPNNSAVALEDIGTDENALLCLANHELSLRPYGPGEWYYPNQTQVFVRSHGATMYRNRGDGIVLLHRVSAGLEGIYRCEIPNSNWELQSLFVRVYSLLRGNEAEFVDGIQFQLNSKLFSDPPTFTLHCLTSGFSTESLWKKDSVTIANSTDYLIIDKVINEARFEILHSLTVTGRCGGLYQFSIRRQNGSSELSRELLIQAPEAPRNFLAKQFGRNSIKVTWSRPSQVSGYYILMNTEDPHQHLLRFVPSNHSQALFSDLNIGQGYNVSMITMYKFLPSASTGIIRIDIKQIPDVTLEILSDSSHAIVDGLLQLTCMVTLHGGSLVNRNFIIEWLNGSTSLLQEQMEGEFTLVSDLSSNSMNHSLRIRNVQTHHSGSYLCRVEMEGVLFEESVYVHIESHNISESIQTQLPDCTLIARDMTAVNGLTSIWYTHSGSVLVATENSTCLRDLLVSNDTCDKTFQSVIGLTSPYLNDDKWYTCSIQLNQFVYEQACLEATTTLDILRGQVNNASSITVSWDSLPCSHQHGRTIGYNVRYTSASLSRSISISSSNIEVSAEVSVSPFTEYEFEVAAIWENDDIGPYTPPITLFSPAEEVGLMLRGGQLQNHSFVNYEDISINSTETLLCATNQILCCDSEHGYGGRWVYPNGTELVQYHSSSNLTGQDRGPSVVYLYRSPLQLLPFGIYHCEIQDLFGDTYKVYVGIYSRDTGELSLADHIVTFNLESEVEADTPLFTLTCISMGGPVTSVSWYKDGEHLNNQGPEGNTYSISTAMIDIETASYRSTLTVTSRRTGEYICRFANNKPSNTSAILMVGAAKQPGNIRIEQRSPTSMNVSWNLSSSGDNVTEFRIYYSSDRDNSMLVALPPFSQIIIENLRYGATYHVSIVALSELLPSLRTPTVDITLVPLPVITVIGSAVPYAGEEYSLSCIIVVDEGLHRVASILWYNANNEVLNGTSGVTSSQLGNNNLTLFTSVLSFQPLQISHGGEYTCQVQLGNVSGTFEQNKRIVVKIPLPNITILANDTGILYTGVSLELTCLIQVQHVNSPLGIDVLWTGQNGDISSSLLNATEYNPYLWKSTLVTSPLVNSGTFTCRASASPIPVGILQVVIPSDSVQDFHFTITPITSPRAPPENFIVTTFKSRMLTFSWSPLPEGKRNGPIVDYYIICCPESSMEDEFLSDECVEDEVTNAPVSLTMFIPGTVYNCSVLAFTAAGEGPPAELLVQTLQDEELFQLHLSGVGNCSQWLTCDGPIKRDEVSDLVESVIKVNCTITNDCYSDLVFEIIDGGFSCGRDDNDVSFKASLRSKGTTTTSQLLANLQSWIILGKVVNINGVFLKVNQLCPVSVDSLGAGMYCESDSLVSMSVCEVDIVVLAGGIVGSFAIVTAVFTCILAITLFVVVRKYRTKRYVISSEDDCQKVESVEPVQIKAESRDTAETELYEIGNVDATAPEDDYDYISIRARYTPAASVIMKQNSEKKELPSDHGSPNGNENPSSNPAVEEGMSSKVTDVKACEVIYENI